MGRLNKRASKRVSLKQKYKIERKVKEHKKKMKKEAKLKPKSTRPKKDPGIPNMYPFKDDLLRKVEDHRARVLAEKEAKKELRKEKRQKSKEDGQKQTKQVSIQQLASDASAKNKAFEIKEKATAGITAGFAVAGGKLTDSSRRAYFKEFKKVITVADVVLQVLDARDPMGCRCIDIEQMILAKDPNKRIVLILNKIDLVPREVVEKWLKFLRNHYPTVAFKSSTQLQRKNLGRVSGPTDINTSECLGADTLIKLLKNYANNKGMKTTITVGIIGYPNVGKSSVINSLMRAKAVGVGATPGFTKTAQEVHLDKHVKLLDSPGIVFAADSSNPDVILRNCVKVEQIEDPVAPVEAILKRCKKQQLLLIYKIPVYNTVQEFLALIAQKYGKLSKGGVPDYRAAAKIVLQDWNGGRIPYYILPPAESSEVHVAAEVVQSWGKEFNLREEDDKRVISHLRPLNDKFVEMEGNLAVMKEASDLLAALGEDDQDSDQMEEDEDGEDDEDDDEDGEDDEDDEDDEDMEEDVDQSSSVSSKKQNLKDASDQFNPQLNKLRKKQQKKEKKKKEKLGLKNQKEEDSDEEDDDYNFKDDFIPSDDGDDEESEDGDAIEEDD